jgi:IQ calmodulin-binding motif
MEFFNELRKVMSLRALETKDPAFLDRYLMALELIRENQAVADDEFLVYLTEFQLLCSRVLPESTFYASLAFNTAEFAILDHPESPHVHNLIQLCQKAREILNSCNDTPDAAAIKIQRFWREYSPIPKRSACLSAVILKFLHSFRSLQFKRNSAAAKIQLFYCFRKFNKVHSSCCRIQRAWRLHMFRKKLSKEGNVMKRSIKLTDQGKLIVKVWRSM